ncbi:MAG: glutathione peroxidase [Acidobacteria bacterium]|nr:glutathione peroxidase [Acidobacteriota bacterium]
MKRSSVITIAVAAIMIAGLIIFYQMKETEGSSAQTKGSMTSVYDITVKDIDGKPVKLDRYKGNVLMIVNVASECGFTPQYEGLQKIYQKYQSQGLVVLGFPANNFGGQEPGSEAEIKTFCTQRYKVTFPMFSKVSAKGSDIHPLYKFLTDKISNPKFAGDVTWNFNKYLIDRKGNTIARFESSDEPEGAEVTQAIEGALKN